MSAAVTPAPASTPSVLTATALEALADAIHALPGVLEARAWTRVPDKERVYIDLTKHNGGRAWNCGVGRRVIVHADGEVTFDRHSVWAGAATRDHHQREGGTLARIDALVDCAFAALDRVACEPPTPKVLSAAGDTALQTDAGEAPAGDSFTDLTLGEGWERVGLERVYRGRRYRAASVRWVEIDEDHPNVYGSHLLGHEGTRGYPVHLVPA